MHQTTKGTAEEQIFETSEHGTSLIEKESSPITKKPERVILVLTYPDGTVRKEALFGTGVPDLEDWEDRADRLWLKEEESKRKPPASIRMIDDAGNGYLRELRY